MYNYKYITYISLRKKKSSLIIKIEINKRDAFVR